MAIERSDLPGPQGDDQPLIEASAITPYQQMAAEQLEHAIRRGREMSEQFKGQEKFLFRYPHESETYWYAETLDLAQFLRGVRRIAHSRYVDLALDGQAELGNGIIDELNREQL